MPTSPRPEELRRAEIPAAPAVVARPAPVVVVPAATGVPVFLQPPREVLSHSAREREKKEAEKEQKQEEETR
jgi:hypothetical protein